jgi:hypothetical protein
VHCSVSRQHLAHPSRRQNHPLPGSRSRSRLSAAPSSFASAPSVAASGTAIGVAASTTEAPLGCPTSVTGGRGAHAFAITSGITRARRCIPKSATAVEVVRAPSTLGNYLVEGKLTRPSPRAKPQSRGRRTPPHPHSRAAAGHQPDCISVLRTKPHEASARRCSSGCHP